MGRYETITSNILSKELETKHEWIWVNESVILDEMHVKGTLKDQGVTLEGK